MQTVALAEVRSGHIMAVDTCHEYLDELRERLKQTDFASRIEVRNDDMTSLSIANESVDLIWCEQALKVIASTEAEIDMRRRYGQFDGYQFFVLRAR